MTRICKNKANEILKEITTKEQRELQSLIDQEIECPELLDPRKMKNLKKRCAVLCYDIYPESKELKKLCKQVLNCL